MKQPIKKGHSPNTVRSVEPDAEELELERMVTAEHRSEPVLSTLVQKHRVKIQSWWSSAVCTTKMKIICTVIAALFIVGGSVVVWMSHQTPPANTIINEKGQDNTMISNDWDGMGETITVKDMSQGDENSGNNDDQFIPQLRSDRRNEGPKAPEKLGHMNIYIGKDTYLRGDTRQSRQRFRFPVAQYNRRRNPFHGPLINFMPWVPIFADRLTKQTVIYAPTGGVYILPPLINMYGHMFSVAQLIASGYASLVSSGVPPGGNIDMFRFFQPQPLLGPGIPIINPLGGGFRGGIRSNFGSFSIPRRYEPQDNADDTSQSEEEQEKEDDDNNYEPESDSYKGHMRPYKRTRYTKTTSPRTKPTEPTTKPTEPTTKPTEPTTKPTEPTTKPTEPTTKPTEPTTKPTEPTTKPTEPTTKPTDPTEPPTFPSILTKCQPDEKPQTTQRAQKIKINLHEKLKSIRATNKIGDHVRLKGAFVIEFEPDNDQADHFQTITDSVARNDETQKLSIEKRLSIKSSLFNGVSISVNDENSTEALAMIEGAIDIHAITMVPRPAPFKSSLTVDEMIDKSRHPIIPHDVSGVTDVHEKLHNYGAGVRVAVIDTGVDYTHPALGGCFGKNCKVAFGYDFVGDKYDGNPSNIIIDDDPYDNCSDFSHGTHVAGIIGANTTGIQEAFYTPLTNFIGVAPQAILGAYRVFGCSGSSTSDIIAKAIYRAYADKADIITMSLGSSEPYLNDLVTIATEKVINQGVYVTVSAGNAGKGGLQTIGNPAILSAAMAVGSTDNSHILQPAIITPDGKNIYYRDGSNFITRQLVIQSTVVVNDPNGGVGDGCNNTNNLVSGAIALFAFNSNDECTAIDRCNKAAVAGAVGCLIYTDLIVTVSSSIPSGVISLDDGRSIVATVTANPSAIYVFTIVAVASGTALTPSYFTSLGLTVELNFKPQISAVGGYVYSTVAPHVARFYKLRSAYAILSGTSMACPYMAGTLALFLSTIGNPAPETFNGHSPDGKCRPKFSVTQSVFQSNAKILNNYNSSLFASTAQQGAGFVNAYKAITTKTVFSPSELALNDTVRQHKSYTVKVFNLGNRLARYEMSHGGAALATGKASNNDQLLPIPLYSADYADVKIEPTKFQVEPGESREITLRFKAPANADRSLLPIYSGFIYATNEANGEVVHLSYAGVVGNYKQAEIFVRQTPSGIITGLLDKGGNYVTNGTVPTLNAADGLIVRLVLAYATHIVYADVTPSNDDIFPGYDFSYGLLYTNFGFFYYNDLTKTVALPNIQGYAQSYNLKWNGLITQFITLQDSVAISTKKLSPGQYRLRFSALKNFGDYTDADDFDVYYTPPFNLI